MNNAKQGRFEVSATELDNRLEEQSILTVVLAISGVLATSAAQASEPSCGPFGGEECSPGCVCHF